jgi:hypothetical protein
LHSFPFVHSPTLYAKVSSQLDLHFANYEGRNVHTLQLYLNLSISSLWINEQTKANSHQPPQPGSHSRKLSQHRAAIPAALPFLDLYHLLLTVLHNTVPRPKPQFETMRPKDCNVVAVARRSQMLGIVIDMSGPTASKECNFHVAIPGVVCSPRGRLIWTSMSFKMSVSLAC